jgi:plastocyanin
MKMNALRVIIAISMAATAACSGQKEPAAKAPAANAKRVDQSKAGRVSGRVILDGAAPANPPINMSGDSYCAQQNPGHPTFENFVVDNGGLENVFVYVKDGLGDYAFDVPTEPVKLDQHGCRYHPHVLGVRVGQKLQVSNSDDTLHNIHAMPTAGGEWVKSQAIKGVVDEKTFTKPEVMVPFKCDVHNWMHAFVGVVDHPYFAVTQDGGKFELKDLPAGTYTLEAWHEKLGTQTATVTLGEKESKEVTFTFKPAAAGTN